jgi:uncharacterized protein
MFRGLLPKEYHFYDAFNRHIKISREIADELLEMTKSNNIDIHVKKIFELERDADKIVQECTESLHKTFITPIERSDIFLLVKRIDDIADNVKTAVSRLKLYEITEIRSEAVQIAEVLVEATRKLEESINNLKDFHDIEKIKQNCIIVHKLENKADDILRNAISRLFKETDPILVIKWKEVFERLEKAVDRCEDLANVIEGILIDNA